MTGTVIRNVSVSFSLFSTVGSNILTRVDHAGKRANALLMHGFLGYKE